jgi:hypothetical protein
MAFAIPVTIIDSPTSAIRRLASRVADGTRIIVIGDRRTAEDLGEIFLKCYEARVEAKLLAAPELMLEGVMNCRQEQQL